MSEIQDAPSVPIELDARFLKGMDLKRGDKWSDFTLTVKRVIPAGEIEVFNTKTNRDEKLDAQALAFEETEKLLPLTAKCQKVAVVLGYGRAPVGKQITVYPTHGRWYGKEQYAVRIRIPANIPSPGFDAKDLGRDLTRDQQQ